MNKYCYTSASPAGIVNKHLISLKIIQLLDFVNELCFINTQDINITVQWRNATV